MDFDSASTSRMMQSAPNTSANPSPQPLIVNRRWIPRRRGACTMCKLKKIRCDGATPCVNCRRHNQECQYVLSKRRQAPKKSASVSTSEKSPESRSQLDEIGKTGSREPTEPSDDAQLSPGLTFSSSVSTGDSNNVSLNTLHWQSSMVDDQNTLRTLCDEYTEDETWNVEIDRDEIQNSLSTTDMRSLLGLGSLSWPLTGTDTDCQFDFHLPFTAENTNTSTTATSTILTDLDSNPFFNPPTDSADTIESSETPGELIKVLNLNDKVMTRSSCFLDPIPSVNFSLKAIFLSQDRGQETVTNGKQNEIYRIFERISHVHSQPSSMNLDDGECGDSYAAWYWNDATLIESCKAACLEQQLGIAVFLPRSRFDKYMKEAKNRPPPCLISLIDSVMAFGYDALVKSTQNFVDPEKKKNAECYSKMALNSRGNALRAPNSLLKLQTILALTTIAEHIDSAIHSELLTEAVNCARALKLENSDLMHCEYANNEDRDLARKCLWYLFSIEVPHSLRRGISPALDRDWIDHPPPQVYDETDLFSLQCLYATTISSAAKMLYNQNALRQSQTEREERLEITYKLLEEWRSRLPTLLKDIHKPNMRKIPTNHRIRHVVLSMFRQYHEAIFMIYFPWTIPQAGCRVSQDCRRKSMEVCVSSAQVILATANQISFLDILDSKFLNLIAVSICMTFLDIASGRGGDKSMSYLSIGCGLFGRLNLETEVPLADVLELMLIAQQIKGR